MFSANENILLRQHKKRVIEYIESTIPEDVLDLGTNVMVMQVICNTPNCAPIETNIIILFPKHPTELLPGLIESKDGGSFQTKILKPLAEVTKEDVLDALPPSFMGGTRSIENICFQIRDQLLGQITQLFDDVVVTTTNNNSDTNQTTTTTTTVSDNSQVSLLSPSSSSSSRYLVARHIQECLQQYIDHNCIPPEIGQPYNDENDLTTTTTSTSVEAPASSTTPAIVDSNTITTTSVESQALSYTIPTTGNVTIPRPVDDNTNDAKEAAIASLTMNTNATGHINLPQKQPVVSLVNSTTRNRQQTSAVRMLQQQQGNGGSTTSSILQQLAAQQQGHTTGIRRPGCPCCDPDSITNIVDMYLSQT